MYWLFAHFFAGLWSEIWKYGLGGALAILFIAAYFFMPAPIGALFPNLRKWLLPAAAVIIFSMASYTVGVVNEKDHLEAQWAVEKLRLEAEADDARAEANRHVAVPVREPAVGGKPGKWVRAPGRDGYDRSRPKGQR